jgi:hypothetical protein
LDGIRLIFNLSSRPINGQSLQLISTRSYLFTSPLYLLGIDQPPFATSHLLQPKEQTGLLQRNSTVGQVFNLWVFLRPGDAYRMGVGPCSGTWEEVVSYPWNENRPLEICNAPDLRQGIAHLPTTPHVQNHRLMAPLMGRIMRLGPRSRP